MYKKIILLLVLPMYAYSLSISPVGIKFNNTKKSAILKLTNENEFNEVYSVQLLKVVHTKNGYTEFKPSNDFMIFPKIIRLKSLKSRKLKVFRNGTSPIYGRYFLKISALSNMKKSDLKIIEKGSDISLLSISVKSINYVRIDIHDKDTTVDNSSIDVNSISIDGDYLSFSMQNNTNNFLRVKELEIYSLDGNKIYKIDRIIALLPQAKIDYSIKLNECNVRLCNKELDKIDVKYKINNSIFMDRDVLVE